MWRLDPRSGGERVERPSRSVRPPRRSSGIVSLVMILAVALMALAAFGAAPLSAQPAPGDSMAVRVGVETDLATYRPNEPVRVSIWIENLGDAPLDLEFPSGCMVNYGIDGDAFNWLSRAACPAVISRVHLPPHARHQFPFFMHSPRDYFLTPGTHEVWGEVLGYGRRSVSITVMDGGNEPAPVLLIPEVTPAQVELGEEVSFAVTLVNLTREVQDVHTPDGCPVRLKVDGWWSPTLICDQATTLITLEPGERRQIRARYLTFDTALLGGRDDAIGPHSAVLQVGTAGETAIRFMVVASGGGGVDGALAGTAHHEDGKPAAGVFVFARPWPTPTDSIPPPPIDSTRGPDGGWTTPPWPGPHPGSYGPAVTEADGSYRMAALPAGDYLVWAQSPDGSIVWYDGARAPDLATRVTVVSGQVTEGINFTILPYVPPPPLHPGVIEGTILNWIPEGSRQPQFAIPGAVVVAIMESAFAWEDSVPPGDDGDGDDDANGDPTGGTTEPRPVPPDGWWVPRYYGLTDAEGHYRIEVPYGSYTVVAGEVMHRYRWFPDAERIEEAEEVVVLPETSPRAAHFTLRELGDAGPATVSGTVHASTDLPPPGGDPTTGTGGRDDTGDNDPAEGEPRPIEGAQVVAHLLIQDPRLMIPAQIVATTTDADGHYTLTLRPNSPVLVQAYAPGYFGQFYNHVADFWNATPVDVSPETPAAGIDFDLQQQALPPDWGNLSGRVTTPDPSAVDRNGEIAERPVAGAVVRIRAAQAGFGPFELVTRTDEQGWWFASGLPYLADGSLTYLVSAEAEGYVPTYHPAAHRAAQATPVSPLPPFVDALVAVDVSLRPQPVNGPYFIAGHVRAEYGATGTIPPDTVPPVGNFGDATGGAPGDSLPPDPGGSVPLIGAFVYVVRLDPVDDQAVVAGAVACDNGTFLLTGLHEGSYLVYADRPGFSAGWFGGENSTEASVIQLGPASPSALLDFELEPLDGREPPPGDDDDGTGGDGETTLNVPMTDLRNAPNPSRPQTTIMYRLRTMSEVTLRVYDINGRLIRTLFDRSLQNAGEQRVPWDGRDEIGETVGAGIYFYRVETARQSATGKMVVVR